MLPAPLTSKRAGDDRSMSFQQPAAKRQRTSASSSSDDEPVSVLTSILRRWGLATPSKGRGSRRGRHDIIDVDEEPAIPAMAAGDISTNGGTFVQGSVRRTPMYKAEATAKAKASREMRFQAVKSTHVRVPLHTGTSTSSGSSGASLLSPASSSSLAVITPPMEYEAYDTPTRQSKSVRGRPSVDAFYAQEPPALRDKSMLSYNPMVDEAYKTLHNDTRQRLLRGINIFKQKSTPKPFRTHESTFEQVLSNAQAAAATPRPKAPPALSFERLRIKEEQKSERLEELLRPKRKWPDRLTLEMQEIVTSTLKQSGIISTLPGAEVTSRDLARLLPTQWLNDEVINFYGNLVLARSQKAKERRDKGKATEADNNLLDIHFYSSFFFEKMSTQGYSAVRRWSKKFDLFKKDIIIMPVNLGQLHWVCAAINVAKKRFEFYDSMGRSSPTVCNTLREYVMAEHLDKKKTAIDLSDWEDYFDPKTPQQENGFDCGVFTSQFIECLSRKDGRFDFHQRNMPYLRQKMVHDIKTLDVYAVS